MPESFVLVEIDKEGVFHFILGGDEIGSLRIIATDLIWEPVGGNKEIWPQRDVMVFGVYEVIIGALRRSILDREQVEYTKKNIIEHLKYKLDEEDHDKFLIWPE